MFELIPFTYLLYIALRQQPLTVFEDKIKEMKSKVDPSIAEELGIESVKQITDLVKTLKYRAEVIDYVQSPREFLESGVGDCEDFAVLVYSLLDYLGLNPKFAIAWNPDDPEAHAFVFYKCPDCSGKYYVFSNKDFFEASSPLEAANMLGYQNIVYEFVNSKIIEEAIKWVTSNL